MWFDETPRLFSVADMLQKKKNKDDNYEFDDIPDIKKQELTGKYDKNFDALGSDFERAHNYNLNNIQQPENTKPEVEYSDKYSNFFKYEPSTYVKLEEDEYKPFSKNDEKANEYYIDNLQGKTLDDLVISKMKENAGAEDLPRDAMRRKFANDLLNQELPSFSSLEFSTPEEEIQEQRNKHKKKTTLRNLNARMNNIVIEAPLSSNPPDKPPRPSKTRKSNRLQGLSASDVPFSPEKQKRQPTQAKDIDTQEEGGGGGISGATPREEVKRERGEKQLLDILGKADENKKVKEKKTTKKDEKAENNDSGGSGGGAKSGGGNKGGKKDNNNDEKDDVKTAKTTDDTKETKPDGEFQKQLRAEAALKRQELAEADRIAKASQKERLDELKKLESRLEEQLKNGDKQINGEDWLTYQAFVRKDAKGKTGNKPKASTALAKLKTLNDAYRNIESSVKQNNLQQIQEEQTIKGNKLNVQGDRVFSRPKTVQTIPMKDASGNVVRDFSHLLKSPTPTDSPNKLPPIAHYASIGGNVGGGGGSSRK